MECVRTKTYFSLKLQSVGWPPVQEQQLDWSAAQEPAQTDIAWTKCIFSSPIRSLPPLLRVLIVSANEMKVNAIWTLSDLVVELCLCTVSVSVSAQDGIVALGKAHTRSAPSLSSLPKVALETVPIFVWLNTDRSRPWRVECRPLPFSTPLSFRRSMLWCSGYRVAQDMLHVISAHMW